MSDAEVLAQLTEEEHANIPEDHPLDFEWLRLLAAARTEVKGAKSLREEWRRQANENFAAAIRAENERNVAVARAEKAEAALDEAAVKNAILENGLESANAYVASLKRANQPFFDKLTAERDALRAELEKAQAAAGAMRERLIRGLQEGAAGEATLETGKALHSAIHDVLTITDAGAQMLERVRRLERAAVDVEKYCLRQTTWAFETKAAVEALRAALAENEPGRKG